MDSRLLKTARNLCALISKSPHTCDAVNALAEQLVEQMDAPREAPAGPPPSCNTCGGRVAWRKGALVCMENCHHPQGPEKHREALQYGRPFAEPQPSEVELIREILGLTEHEPLLDAVRRTKLAADANRSVTPGQAA